MLGDIKVNAEGMVNFFEVGSSKYSNHEVLYAIHYGFSLICGTFTSRSDLTQELLKVFHPTFNVHSL